MNFLAHLVLAPQTPEGLIGAIAPDLIRGPLPKDLHPAVLEAAMEHRRVDRFTDAHRAFLRTRDRLKQSVDPRLAGVLADVLFDHVLASAWPTWCEGQLEERVARIESSLWGRRHLMPTHMREVVEKMRREQWLTSYQSPEGTCARLRTMAQRISHRLGRPMRLAISASELVGMKPALADDFAELWPDLRDFVYAERVRRVA